jgi:2-C-methyl-D-erythritol 4-phosphate cytidylyltransferase
LAVALIVAAGRGERLGADRPKALVALAGRPLLEWSLRALSAVSTIERIVVALPADLAPAGAHALAGEVPPAETLPGVRALPGVQAPPGTLAVPGGAVRSESVRLALAAAGPGRDSDLVLVHDAARPLLTPELAKRVLAAVAGCGEVVGGGEERVDAAIAAAPVTDTVKRADREGRVLETLDRSELWAVQTPQVFRRAALERALDVPDEVLAQATDDAWLIERASGSVRVVAAPPENLKVTTALDLRLAELLLAARRA